MYYKPTLKNFDAETPCVVTCTNTRVFFEFFTYKKHKMGKSARKENVNKSHYIPDNELKSRQ